MTAKHLPFLKIAFPVAAFFLTASGFASPSASTFACVAKIDCGSPSLPSTQDLPSDKNLVVKSDSLESARTQCSIEHSDSYANLAKTLVRMTPEALVKESHGCKILGEAIPLRTREKRARAPSAN